MSQDDGLLAIAELQHKTGTGEGGLAGTHKVGGWYRAGAVTRAASAEAGLFESLPDILRHNFSF